MNVSLERSIWTPFISMNMVKDRRKNASSSSTVLLSLLLVASISNEQHQFEQTSIYLNKCISILKRNVSPSCSSNTILLVDVLRKYAQTLFNCRKFDDARRTIAEAQFLLDQISPISLNEEDSSSNSHVLQTMEDLKAKCDLCIG